LGAGGLPPGLGKKVDPSDNVGGPITDPSRLIPPKSLDDIWKVNPQKIGDFSDISGSTVQDILQRVPPNATMRKLTPQAGGSQVGVEFRWEDSNGQKNTLRIHDPDPSAPVGSNAATGWIVRHQIGSRYFDPTTGTLQPRNVHNPRSIHYNPNAANNTHIPIKTPEKVVIDLMKK